MNFTVDNLSKRIAELPPEKRKILLERLKKKSGEVPRDRIERRERKSNTFPLSYAQERLWFLEQLDPGNYAYNFVFGDRIEGSLNVEALEQALNEIIKRHGSLRTAFRSVKGQPVQVIEEEVILDLPVSDLGQLSETEKDVEIARHITEIGQTSFHLSQAPLLQARLLRREETVHVLLVCIHHIVTDGWSMGVFYRELTRLYQAFANGQPSSSSNLLPELPIQYGDFALWQKEWLQGEVLEQLLSYWMQQLAGIQTALELPTDRPRPAVQTFPGAIHSFILSEDLTAALKILSRDEETTLFMTLLAAFKTLLFRYTGQNDIVVGSPIANRDRTEIEDLIGFFVNTLVLRTDLSGNPSFRQLLARTREVALGAFTHQDLPFEKLVEEIQPERDLSTTPLFQVMFILHNPVVDASDTNLKFGNPLPQANDTAKYDLTLYVEHVKDEMLGTFEYNTDLFDASTIKRMAEHFLCLLGGIVKNPEQRILELPMLSEAERQQLLVEWNDTEMDYPTELCFHHLFEDQVNKTPSAVALVYGDKHLTYGELNSKANQLAHSLMKAGVGPDILVGIYIERSLDMLVGLLGILKAGGAYVPLDPSYPKERLAYMLKDAQPLVLLTQDRLRGKLFEQRGANREEKRSSGDLFAQLNVISLDTEWDKIAHESTLNPVTETKSTNLAYVIYTSGSTGKPKGVAIQHQSLVNFLTSMCEAPGLAAGDSLVAVTTLSFDIAALEFYLPLAVGAQVIIASPEEAGDGRQLGEMLNESGATVMQATPATWRMLLDTGWSGNQQLKILCGGEALPRELANDLLEKGHSLWNLYGPTETTIWSSVLKIEDKEGPVRIGPPIGNTAIYILGEGFQSVPVGVYGELCIGGEGLARGYLNRAELTAEKFVPDPFSGNSGARLYRTGDLARYLPDGKIEFRGRIDHQVKVRGFRIELGEIEAVCVQHTAIQEAVVMPREMAVGDMRLVAYIKYDSNDEPTVSELRNYIKEKLPDYMVPSLFVTMDTFPLTPNGKIDRNNLPVPAGMHAESNEAHVPPSSVMEKFIVEVWQEVLGMDGFSLNDNFFEIGGHSLLSMKVLYLIEKKLGLRVNPREIMFKNLGQLAALCEQELAGGQKPRAKRKLFDRIKEAVSL